MSVLEIAMGLIAEAGDAKSYAVEAISRAREGDFAGARECLDQAKHAMVGAHDIQTELIRNEISGTNQEISLIMVHAQDHLTGAMLMRELAEEFIIMYEKIKKLEEKEC